MGNFSVSILLSLLLSTSLVALAFDHQCDETLISKKTKHAENDYIKTYFDLLKPSQRLAENSAYSLIDALIGIDQYFTSTPESFVGAKASTLPRAWRTNKGQIVPLRYFIKFWSLLKTSSQKHLFLEPYKADVLATALLKILCDDLNLSWSEFRQFLAQHQISVINSTAELKRSLEQIQAILNVDRNFDIPELAGYTVNNPRDVFIDRGVRDHYTLPNTGKRVNIIPYLALHEAIEKTLMLELSQMPNFYFRTHQIAQRVEKLAVALDGYSWHDYQGHLLQNEIKRALNKPLKQTPHDLDDVPTFSEPRDDRLLYELRRHRVIRSNVDTGTFVPFEIPDLARVEMPLPRVFHLRFADVNTLAKSLVRFQEFFESPKFHGNAFTRSEFRQWYKSQNHGQFDYYKFWDGFNFPGKLIEQFRKAGFTNLTAAERTILNLFSQLKMEDYYVIATADDSEPATFDHELTHALYYTQPIYRESVNNVLLSNPHLPILMDFLTEKLGDYDYSVQLDEAHAWLLHNSGDLAEMGLDLTPFRKTIRQLRRINPTP